MKDKETREADSRQSTARYWLATRLGYLGPIALTDEAMAEHYRENGWTVIEVAEIERRA